MIGTYHRSATLVKPWIDADAHFYPPETPERRNERLVPMRAGDWQVTIPPSWGEVKTLANMNRTGIARQMLSTIPNNLDELKASNDFGASLAKNTPKQFGFLMALPTDNPQEALEKMERAINE